MIPVGGAERRFRDMLAEASFDEARPDPRLAWRVFRRFGAVPVECAEDGLMFQCGVYGSTGRESFHFDFLRHLGWDEGGVRRIAHLHCRFHYEPDAGLREMDTMRWSFGFARLDGFFAGVERLPEFRAPLGRTPVRVQIFCEDV